MGTLGKVLGEDLKRICITFLVVSIRVMVFTDMLVPDRGSLSNTADAAVSCGVACLILLFFWIRR